MPMISLLILLWSGLDSGTTSQLGPTIPPPPAGVTHLRFQEIFAPIGRRGLEFSEKARSLAGCRVRILGYMVRQDRPQPGMLLLSPIPVQLHESEYGLADDLPPSTIHVSVPDLRDQIVHYTRGPLLLTGTLSLGNQEEGNGRISVIRLTLDAPDVPDRKPLIKH